MDDPAPTDDPAPSIPRAPGLPAERRRAGRAFSTDGEAATERSDADGILGLDNVRLELPLAGLGSRGLAVALDGVVLGVLLLVWFMLSYTISEHSSAPRGWVYAVSGIGAFLLQWSYFFVCEWAMDGQTPGKTLVGLRTVGHLGGRPSVGALLVRNLLRAIDALVGPLLMVIDRRYRRLGDWAASTLVVHDAEKHDEGEVRLGAVPAGWGAREVAVVESFLRRAPRMEPAVEERLGRRLLQWIERGEPGFVARLEEHPDAPGREVAAQEAPTQRLHRLFGTGGA